MQKLEQVADQIRQKFDLRNAKRDQALAQGGEILLTGMKTRVSKDTHNLENSLKIDGPHQDGGFHYIELGGVIDADDDTARYGNVQEFGSAHTPAQPYVRTTVDGDMAKARAEMRKVLVQVNFRKTL